MLPPALARSARSSSTTSSLSGISSSIAAMDVDDNRDESLVNRHSGGLSEPFEDLGALFDQGISSDMSEHSSVSSLASMRGSSQAGQEVVGRNGDSGDARKTAQSSLRSSTNGKRKRVTGGASEDSAHARSGGSDDENSMEGHNRRTRRVPSKTVRR